MIVRERRDGPLLLRVVDDGEVLYSKLYVLSADSKPVVMFGAKHDRDADADELLDEMAMFADEHEPVLEAIPHLGPVPHWRSGRRGTL